MLEAAIQAVGEAADGDSVGGRAKINDIDIDGCRKGCTIGRNW